MGVHCLVFCALAPAVADTAHDSAEAIAERIGSGNPVLGKSKSVVCQACHGVDGHSAATDSPKLAGQYADYLIGQVRNFQSGARRHPAISEPAFGISEADVADIAAYFASQNTMAGNGPQAGVPIQSLYARGDPKRDVLACASCHGENGKSNFNGSDSSPVIGGQHQAYLRTQLIQLRAGHRKSGAGGVMNLIAKSLKDEEIEALSDYISALK
ncbi:MAG: c-type cytochrome [Rubrivivax sp.]|nr:MAG: c-type cytochrome [Rubrivivax sp.]